MFDSSSLPIECWEIIINELDLNDILEFMFVCKYLNNITKSIMKPHSKKYIGKDGFDMLIELLVSVRRAIFPRKIKALLLNPDKFRGAWLWKQGLYVSGNEYDATCTWLGSHWEYWYSTKPHLRVSDIITTKKYIYDDEDETFDFGDRIITCPRSVKFRYLNEIKSHYEITVIKNLYDGIDQETDTHYNFTIRYGHIVPYMDRGSGVLIYRSFWLNYISVTKVDNGIITSVKIYD